MTELKWDPILDVTEIGVAVRDGVSSSNQVIIIIVKHLRKCKICSLPTIIQMFAMKELENHAYLFGYIISNCFALAALFFAVKSPRLARIFFFLLFTWASWFNWRTALQSPDTYVGTSAMALTIYRDFITGWFSKHVVLVIGFIATSQALIAISLLLKGWMYKTGIIGAIFFLLAIMPLGIASAFPSTVIMAYAMVWLLRRKADYIWKNHTHENTHLGLRNNTSHFLHHS